MPGMAAGNASVPELPKKYLSRMPGGFFIYEADGDERITYVNENVLKLYRCRDMEAFWSLTNGSFKGMVHPEDLERVETYTEIGLSLAAEGLDREERLSAEQWIEQGPSDTGQSPEDISPGKGGMPGWAKGTGTEEKRRRECLEEFGTFLRLRAGIIFTQVSTGERSGRFAWPAQC